MSTYMKRKIKTLRHEFTDLDDLYARYFEHRDRMYRMQKGGLYSTTRIFIGTPHELLIDLYEIRGESGEA